MGYIYTKSGKLAKRLYFGAVLLFEGLYYTFKNRVLADEGTFVENELPTISQDAKLVLTPNAYKSGKLYSAVPNDGTGDFTVDRNSTATYIGQDGLIKTALANVPRIDWSTGEAAVLVEPQRTNLVTYSEPVSGSQVTSFSGVNFLSYNWLNGFTNCIRYNITTGTVFCKVGLSQSSAVYTLSAFIIMDDFSKPSFGETSANDAYMRLATIKATSYRYTDCGNNIWRVEGTATTGTSNDVGFLLSNDIQKISTHSNKEFRVVGWQLEQASKPLSYIPTNGSTVTRLADDISVPTPAGVTAITETIDGVEQDPITTIPPTYSLPVGNINKITML